MIYDHLNNFVLLWGWNKQSIHRHLSEKYSPQCTLERNEHKSRQKTYECWTRAPRKRERNLLASYISTSLANIS